MIRRRSPSSGHTSTSRPNTPSSHSSTPVAHATPASHSEPVEVVVISPFELQHEQSLKQIGRRGFMDHKARSRHVDACEPGTYFDRLILTLVDFVILYLCQLFFRAFGTILYFIFIRGPLKFSLARIHLGVVNSRAHINVEDLFEGFKRGNYTRAIETYVFKVFGVCWRLLLFVVPGIVQYFSYSMSWFILVRHPSDSAVQALASSKFLMAGYRTDYVRVFSTLLLWSIYLVPFFMLGSGSYLSRVLSIVNAFVYMENRFDALVVLGLMMFSSLACHSTDLERAEFYNQLRYIHIYSSVTN